MAKLESPPFERGATFFNGGTVDSTSGSNLEGNMWTFEDLDLSGRYSATQGGSTNARSNRPIKCMVVRNASGITLLPKRLVTLQASGLYYLGRVDGYATTDAQGPAFPVDEWLPDTGVVANDLFWIVVEGPAMCLMPLSQVAAIAVGDIVYALTAATSGATTAGAFSPGAVPLPRPRPRTERRRRS